MKIKVKKGNPWTLLTFFVVRCQTNSIKPLEVAININDAARVYGNSKGTWNLAEKYKRIVEQKVYDCSKYIKPQLKKKKVKRQCASSPTVCEGLELYAKTTVKIAGKTVWIKNRPVQFSKFTEAIHEKNSSSHRFELFIG